MQLNEKNKNRIYLVLSVICVALSIYIIAWIDRQEVDKKNAEQAKLMYEQETPDNKISESNAQIKTKNEAEDSLKSVDDLINLIGEDDSTAQ